jgi:hypothetical protein
MSDQDSKRRIKGRRKNTLFKLTEQDKENNKPKKFESCRLEEKMIQNLTIVLWDVVQTT